MASTPDGDFGIRVISEIRKRKLYGLFFTFKQYSRLKEIRTPLEFKDFMGSELNIHNMPATDDTAVIVECLEAILESKDGPVFKKDGSIIGRGKGAGLIKRYPDLFYILYFCFFLIYFGAILLGFYLK